MKIENVLLNNQIYNILLNNKILIKKFNTSIVHKQIIFESRPWHFDGTYSITDYYMSKYTNIIKI